MAERRQAGFDAARVRLARNGNCDASLAVALSASFDRNLCLSQSIPVQKDMAHGAIRAYATIDGQICLAVSIKGSPGSVFPPKKPRLDYARATVHGELDLTLGVEAHRAISWEEELPSPTLEIPGASVGIISLTANVRPVAGIRGYFDASMSAEVKAGVTSDVGIECTGDGCHPVLEFSPRFTHRAEINARGGIQVYAGPEFAAEVKIAIFSVAKASARPELYVDATGDLVAREFRLTAGAQLVCRIDSKLVDWTPPPVHLGSWTIARQSFPSPPPPTPTPTPTNPGGNPGGGNPGGGGPQSTPTRTPIPPPQAPTNFRVTGVTATSVSLAWNASPGAQSYEVTTTGVGTRTTTATSATIGGLNPGTTYTFSIRAVGPGGKSGSVSVSATTLSYRARVTKFEIKGPDGKPVDIAHLRPGQRAFVRTEVQNIGTATWERGGPNPVRVGTVAPKDRSSGSGSVIRSR